jgi:predicted transcriptional regulator
VSLTSQNEVLACSDEREYRLVDLLIDSDGRSDMSEPNSDTARLVTLTADIVSAYVSNNHVQSADLAKLLSDVHGAICNVSAAPAAADTTPSKATAQEIRRSISHDFLISFEDGKPYKTLRRHLTLRGLSPEQYRTKWGLSPDYPMTSASYSEQRSELARALGLGQQRRKSAAAAAPEPVLQSVPVDEAAAKKPRAPRKKKDD